MSTQFSRSICTQLVLFVLVANANAQSYQPCSPIKFSIGDRHLNCPGSQDAYIWRRFTPLQVIPETRTVMRGQSASPAIICQLGLVRSATLPMYTPTDIEQNMVIETQLQTIAPKNETTLDTRPLEILLTEDWSEFEADVPGIEIEVPGEILPDFGGQQPEDETVNFDSAELKLDEQISPSDLILDDESAELVDQDAIEESEVDSLDPSAEGARQMEAEIQTAVKKIERRFQAKVQRLEENGGSEDEIRKLKTEMELLQRKIEERIRNRYKDF